MDVLEKAGKKVVLLGNEAIARGAIESGVGVAAAYPGTPSSEVPMTLSRVAKKLGFYFEYSPNEKVAFETAAGAAWCGVRAITAVKHFGLNVASDSVLPVAYTGVTGGLVVMVADDPMGWSSAQSEQDTRYFARMARMPMIEPSNPQECLDLTKVCFDISEEFRMPVFLRTTTKISHTIGTVKLGTIKKPKTRGKFKKNKEMYLNIRPLLQKKHREVDQKLVDINNKYASRLNKVFQGHGKTGVITSGVSFDYAREALLMMGLKPPMAKVVLSHPLSEKFIGDFIRGLQTVLVLEEQEPIIEDFVNQVAKDANPKLAVHGKDMLPRYGEFNLETIMPAIGKVFGKKYSIDFAAHKKQAEAAIRGLPPRKPVFCPGCPHRSTFYAVREVFGDTPVFAGDVGCYVLGMFEPYDMQDFMVSMGASLGVGHGIRLVSDQDVIAFIGDSTFFHASMPAIVNLKYNDAAPLVIIMDNSWTAMTGHQPHPGTGITGMGDKVPPVLIEDIVKSMGAEVRVVNAFSQKAIIDALKELKKMKGLRVLVSRGECRLVTKRKLSHAGRGFATFQIDQKKCKKCGVCTNEFACPAIVEVREKAGDEPTYTINEQQCWGCTVCSQVCPHGAIHPIAAVKQPAKKVKK
jgi:indolepyruvate ferredoxin oxidoreductase alpha subunit